MTVSDRYAVFGNPVKHSKSPQIHAAFASQTEQQIQYRAVRVAEGEFASAASRFFADGGRGLNITLPFKRDAFEFADELSPRAQQAGAVNTLSRTADGLIAGDNTDGIGLLRDMIANLGWSVASRRVLVLGAGGAVCGVLEPLLRERPAQLLVVNRTASKAEQLARDFAALGPITGGGFERLPEQQFDLLINGTSASLSGELPPLPDTLLTERSCCYDMMYGPEPTVFTRWAAQHTAWAVADGLGMLVEQAAESFYLWRNQRPQTGPVIAELRAAMAGE
ncbi:MAG: shikimate dehydrogenase [Gammaproteobacteria bacterium]|nr:shikimate dehydrogenase [Gammaproteobacteria bacterium]